MGTAGQDVTIAEGLLLPCIVQDAETGDVLMLAYVDAEALGATQDTGLAHFHSRTRDELWLKGATSGNVMRVQSVELDCDRDTVLMRVRPTGPACHTGQATCFGRRVGAARPAVLAEIAEVIGSRLRTLEGESYVASLLRAPRDSAARKVGEEAVETLLAPAGSDALVAEVADLWFHTMVLLARDGLDPLSPLDELRRRRR